MRFETKEAKVWIQFQQPYPIINQAKMKGSNLYYQEAGLNQPWYPKDVDSYYVEMH